MVSVILPFYNAESTLELAVKSIIDQSFSEFELILIDNDSSDNSLQIAKELATQDKRIVLTQEHKRGVVHAHNKGLQISRYELISRMDADDIALPLKLEKQVSYLRNNPEVGLVATQVDSPNLEGGFREYINWQNEQCTNEQITLSRFVESPIANPTILYRKSLCENYGSYEDNDLPEDYELYLRWLHNGVRMAKIPEVLLQWNDSPTRLTRTDDRYSEAAFYAAKTKYLVPWLKKNNPYFPEVVIWGSGEKSRKRASLLKEQGCNIHFYIDIDCKGKQDCIHYSEIPFSGKYFIISYVSNWGARQKIKEFLQSKGYEEGKNFILAS